MAEFTCGDIGFVWENAELKLTRDHLSKKPVCTVIALLNHIVCSLSCNTRPAGLLTGSIDFIRNCYRIDYGLEVAG